MLNNKKYHLDGHAQWLSNLGAAAFVIDANHNVIFWNRACELLTAVHSEEVLNTNKQWLGFYKSERACLADLVMRDNWEKNIHLYLDIRKTSNTSRGLQAHNWCNTPAGKKYLIFEANALFDEYGNIIGAVETLRDATDLKQLEEQLGKLSRAVESSPFVVFITDLQGRIEYVNPKFIEVTGYSAAEVIGKDPRILKSDKTPDSIYTDLWKKIVAGEEWKGEIHNRKKDGSY